VGEVGLNLVQLHGDEPPEFLAELRGIPILRALRPGADLAAIGEYLQRCYALACLPRMVLIDACASGAFGGTGQTADWQAMRDYRVHLAGQPLVLAGGLTPSNVATAIATVRPWAVDVASGVEERPGKKSAELVRAFVAAARAAFAHVAAND
jgi:phosphoribosylanthranilate isomerase